MAQPGASQVLNITEATFARRVLAAPLPVVVRFGAPTCDASRALTPAVERLAAPLAGQLRVARVNAAASWALAEDYGIEALPTLAVFQHGELLTRAVGFLPEGLLRLLVGQVARGELPRDPVWSPTEELFEDLVLLPLLDAWGLSYERQVGCGPAQAGGTRGRIDVLAFDGERPLTLFENKRRFGSPGELQQAAAQAHRYARAIGLGSFVVAAPPGMWLYRCAGATAVCARQATSLELQRDPRSLLALLRKLGP